MTCLGPDLAIPSVGPTAGLPWNRSGMPVLVCLRCMCSYTTASFSLSLGLPIRLSLVLEDCVALSRWRLSTRHWNGRGPAPSSSEVFPPLLA